MQFGAMWLVALLHIHQFSVWGTIICITQSHFKVGQWKHQKLSSAETAKSRISSPQNCHFFTLQRQQIKGPRQNINYTWRRQKWGIYFTANSLIEGCWIGHISITIGQQTSTVQSIKSNLIGLEFWEWLDRVFRTGCVITANMTLGHLSAVNFNNERQNQSMIQQHLGTWGANLYPIDRAELIN